MTLIEKLEAATVGSRELDAEIYREISSGDDFIVGIDYGENWAFATTKAGGRIDILPYTTSLDASLPGENIIEMRMWEDLFVAQNLSPEPRLTFGRAHTEPLARRIAALKARGV